MKAQELDSIRQEVLRECKEANNARLLLEEVDRQREEIARAWSYVHRSTDLIRQTIIKVGALIDTLRDKGSPDDARQKLTTEVEEWLKELAAKLA